MRISEAEVKLKRVVEIIKQLCEDTDNPALYNEIMHIVDDDITPHVHLTLAGSANSSVDVLFRFCPSEEEVRRVSPITIDMAQRLMQIMHQSRHESH